MAASGCKWLQVAAGSKWLQVAAFAEFKTRVICTLSANYRCKRTHNTPSALDPMFSDVFGTRCIFSVADAYGVHRQHGQDFASLLADELGEDAIDMLREGWLGPQS